MTHFSTESAEKLLEIETHLGKHPYLSEGVLPSAADARVFTSLTGAPDRTKYPNFYYWFIFIKQFTPTVLSRWEESDGKKPAQKTEAPKAQKKQKGKEQKAPEVPKATEVKKEAPQQKQQDIDLFGENKPAQTKKAEDDIDLFGENTTPAPAPVEKKPEVPKKKEKKKVVAKSIVVFDVKVYDSETNLDDLAQKIFALQIDGLVWNKEPKKLEVAYGILKLQVGCVIEDDKVLTDDIFEKIEAWEEVQSTDTVSFQKL